MNDLIAKITAPIGSVKSVPDNTPATVDAPATPVKETELVNPAPPPPLEAVSVGEADLLGGQSTPAPATPATPAPDGKRKRGRPFGSKNPPKRDANGHFVLGETTAPVEPESASIVPNIGDIQTAAQAVVVDYKLMAEATFDLTTGVAATTLGPEWQPRNEDEKQMVCVPLARYFEYKQVKDLPPNLALALVVVAYSAPRLREPGTASKLRMLWAWTKEKIRSLRGK